MTATTDTGIPPRRSERLAFIEERLFWVGRVNSGDLIERFGISKGQASADVSRYREMQPRPILYDPKERAFVAPSDVDTILTRPSMDRLLDMARTDPLIGSDAVDFGFMAPVGRHVDVNVARAVVRAVTGRRSLRITYFSLSSGKSTKTLSPHALATDGMRFHARAWDHDRKRFADFVLGRITEPKDAGLSPVDCDEDVDWLEIERIALVPNPAFPPEKRKAVEMDFGMRDGRLEYAVRRSMLIYADARMLLNSSFSDLPPVKRPIVPVDQASYDDTISNLTSGATRT